MFYIFGNKYINYLKFLGLRGTPYYLAPELWKIYNKSKDKTKYNPKATDVYALGIIILELLLGE